MALGTVGKVTLADIDVAEFKRNVLQEIAKQYNAFLSPFIKSNTVRNNIREIVDRNLKSTPEYESLVGGDLKDVFGIENTSSVVTNIVDAITNAMEIDYVPVTPKGDTISGSVTISLVRKDLSEVLSVTGGSYESKGGSVPWLKWLLTAGDSIVVADYNIDYGNVSSSRTGSTIMIRSSDGFRVPPEYSGTVDNNWITRALEDVDISILNMLQIEITSRVR